MKKEFYIIHSEYVQHGLTFNSENRYAENQEKADEVFDEVLNSMRLDNKDMLEDKEYYKVTKSNRKGKKYFSCYYKYQPGISNFTVEMSTATME